MRQLSDSELKEYQLMIMDKIHDFCISNGIRYSLAGGTLIGAIRHNGFIPWDDDIDIAMPREDYEKFIELFNAENMEFHAYSIKNDVGYNLHYCKVCYQKSRLIEDGIRINDIDMGIFVDLFPLDSLPDDIDDAKILKKLRRLDKLMFGKSYVIKDLKLRPIRQQILILAYKFAAFMFSKRSMGKMQENIAKKYSNRITSCYGAITCHLKSSFIPRWNEEDIVTIEHIFDGRTYLISKGYDHILRDEYGDYMELPPVDKRHSSHSISAWIE